MYDLIFDREENIYVTGPSRGPGTDFDYATIKYNTSGKELWVARYDGPVNGWDEAYSLAVDAAGNVIVTGESQGFGTSADYATVKYDSSGNELWSIRYDGPVSGWDAAYDLTLDDYGNVYVAGESRGQGTVADFATIKYSHSGHELWTARYNGPGNKDDVPNAIGLDKDENVYVAGTSMYPLDISSVYTIIKYKQNDKTNTDLNYEKSVTFHLSQNYPNPINPTTVIPYSIPKTTHIQLSIYNLRGERILTLVDEHKPSGQYAVEWNGKDQSGNPVASGIYLYRLEAEEYVQTRKMLFVR